jgi:hypothetical protein
MTAGKMRLAGHESQHARVNANGMQDKKRTGAKTAIN